MSEIENAIKFRIIPEEDQLSILYRKRKQMIERIEAIESEKITKTCAVNVVDGQPQIVICNQDHFDKLTSERLMIQEKLAHINHYFELLEPLAIEAAKACGGSKVLSPSQLQNEINKLEVRLMSNNNEKVRAQRDKLVGIINKMREIKVPA